MRRPASSVALLFAVSILAGCLDADAPEARADDVPETPGGSDRSSHGGDGSEEPDPAVLGQASGGITPPGEYPFPVAVPAGGATGVRWVLAVQPAGSGLDLIEAPECPADGSPSSSTFIGSHTETSDPCPDLAEGNRTFTIVLHQPVQAFSASVSGVPAAAP